MVRFAARQQLKTSLGQQNADLQITRYGVKVQPHYVLDHLASQYLPHLADRLLDFST
ncbi:hypothetical protein IC235_02920 [Hymenobacter sp. BT664]|uniref:Uncharacterized protein n=1 Tax=Hymenobacter montanus TaxID=2771359 RepID=A0A927GHY9_9BACT|nr:hypothetical protein [Hymenobacter montanus]MBD2766842.1 hypothetical protein [Hymenobacter montanus]